jgi:hypothetical protein
MKKNLNLQRGTIPIFFFLFVLFFTSNNLSAQLTIATSNANYGNSSTVNSLTGVPAGALLVLVTTGELHSTNNCAVSSSPSLTWTKRADAEAVNSGDAEIWTAIFSSGGSITVTSDWYNATKQAAVCYTITGQESALGGASATGTGQSAPSVDITTTRANSIVFGGVSDWNAIDGSSRTYRDGASETQYHRDAGAFTSYSFYKSSSTAGSRTEGLSAPTGQSAGTVLYEVRPSVPVSPSCPSIVDLNTAYGNSSTVNSLTGVPAGALLVLVTTGELHSTNNCAVSSSPSLTWTKQADAEATNSGDAEIWTATYSAGGSITITSDWYNATKQAGVVYVITGAEGTLSGASATGTGQSAPSVNLTTTRTNSIIIGGISDWNATSGSSRTYRDAATETFYHRDAGAFTSYSFYKLASTAASHTEGLTAPTGQSAGTVLYEIRCNTDCVQPIEGFGSVTSGGSGGTVVTVTTLAAGDSPGSLMEAMKSNSGHNVTIVFDHSLSGTIDGFRWDSSNEGIDWSNLTIDGSTAASPGITILGYAGSTFNFEGSSNHDIIIKNLRIRGNPGEDNITITDGAYNFVIDHCSFSGSQDGAVDITAGSHDVTVQWSIFGPIDPVSSGPMLIAFDSTKNVSIHHNLFASRGEGTEGARNPLVHNSDNINTTRFMADIRNNLIWNWGNSNTQPCCGFGYGTELDYGATANIVNNYYFTDGSETASAIIFNHESSNARGYVDGNVNGSDATDPNSISNHAEWSIPSPAQVTTTSACEAAAMVLSCAGVHPLDEIDQAIVESITLSGCGSPRLTPAIIADKGTGPGKEPNSVKPKNDNPLNFAIVDLFPNPARTEMNVVITTAKQDDVNLIIMDINGKIIQQQQSRITKGSNTVSVNVSKLMKGTYLVKVVCKSNCETTVNKFVKL